MTNSSKLARLLGGLLVLGGLSPAGMAQSRWPGMPGYQEYRDALAAQRNLPNIRVSAQWTSATTVRYSIGGEAKEFDVASGVVRDVMGVLPEPMPQDPGRGRQFSTVTTEDGKTKAEYKDGNVWLTVGDGNSVKVTPDGDLAKRVKYGTASWVYGEELDQRHAMGFSPDGTKLWMYRFDESPVKDYHLALGQDDQYTEVAVEAYPKPGTENPIVDLVVYDLLTKKLITVKVRPGAFDNGMGHYVYAISWGEDSQELFFHRMDRRQKTKEFCAANAVSGAVRVVDREANPAGWVEFMPLIDLPGARRSRNPEAIGDRMLFKSEADGFMNLYWLDTKAGVRRQVTKQKGDVVSVLKVDEGSKTIWFTCADGETAYRHQLYRVGFDGSGLKLLTDRSLHNEVSLSPDGRWFTAVSETADQAPVVTVRDMDGKLVKELGGVEVSGDVKMPLAKWISVKAADGETDLWVEIDFPMNFDPGKKYPVMVDVYGGPLPPGWGSPSESFRFSRAQASTGFLWVKIHGRGENGRGRAFRQAIYRNMGIVEIDDQAAGVKGLGQFAWADLSRVGINGTSYGGYASAMAVLRHPDVFHAGCASSMVSQWTNYDTTYTERYMDLLSENEAGYKAGSCMTYAGDLKGWLMLYYGTSDDNTHPANTMQLANALARAGKSFELQVGVDRGHTGLRFERMMEFFVERLVMGRD